MTSTIYIYKDCKIIPSKNFVVDSIDTYLANLTKITILDFQYLRNDLNLTIKINKTQDWTDATLTYNYNYLKVVQNSVSYYYFIVKKTQLSQSTIALELRMDVLNTYKWDTDFKVSDRTKVSREHKDRFYRRYTIYSSSSAMVDSLQNEEWDKYYKGTLTYLKDGVNKTCSCIMCHRKDVGLAHVKLIYFYDVPKATYEDIDITCLFRSFVADTGETLRTYNDTQMSFSKDVNLIRNIDLKSEDIPAPLFKKDENIIYENNGEFTNSWTLYYKNHNGDSSPVECYLMTDTDLKITIGDNNVITASDVPLNKYLLLSRWYVGIDFIVEDDDHKVAVYNQWLTTNRSQYNCVVLWNDGGTLKWASVDYQYRGLDNYARKADPYTPIIWWNVSGNLVIRFNKALLPCREMSSVAGPWTGGTASYPFYKSRADYTLTIATTTETLASKNTIDKTLSDNIKIINLPYSPSSFSIDNLNFSMESIWSYDGTSKFFKLIDTSARFKNTIYTNVENPLEKFLAVENFVLAQNTTRYLSDPKLLHSDFYRNKFVYDSFSKVFPLEQIDYEKSLSYATGINMDFEFYASRNIVSKFLFLFPYSYKVALEDYPNALPVERNNEEVLYNSAYINYIRNGYNYDVKSKKRSEVASGVGIGISALGTIASAAVGGPFGAVAAVSFGTSLLTSLINYAKTTAQNEENISRKVQETQRQAVSVLNADDFDLLEAYSNNKAKLCLYEASDMMKGILDDIFYYVGYKVDEMKIPSIDTRFWFNFVSCELEFTGVSKNMSDSVKADIVQRYKDGTTFLHTHEISGSQLWDFEQVKENWETSLIN